MKPCPRCGHERILYHMYQQYFQCAWCAFRWPRQFATGQPAPPARHAADAPDPAEVPVLHGSVIGFREWGLVRWQLGSTGVGALWSPGVNTASCRSFAGHASPVAKCQCGLYAYARRNAPGLPPAGQRVGGAIEAWSETRPGLPPAPGEIATAAGVEIRSTEPPDAHGLILHSTGFRARYARVVLLAIEDDWPAAKTAAVRALAAEHGADVCRAEHLADAAREHGQLVPDELLEWATENDCEGEFARTDGLSGPRWWPSR